MLVTKNAARRDRTGQQAQGQGNAGPNGVPPPINELWVPSFRQNDSKRLRSTTFEDS